MQKSFSVGCPGKEHIPSLKKMWADVFGDSEDIINNFFSKTAKTENIVCAFYGNEPVSVLYMIDSSVLLKGLEYKAYYIYAVCTRNDFRGNNLSTLTFKYLENVAKERGISYLFLVPAEKSLFGMYEKLGFGIGFTYCAKTEYRKDFPEYNGEISGLSFKDYKSYRSLLENIPYAILGEDGFRSFYNPVECDVNCISVNEKGFALYENNNGKITVYELFGDERILLSAVFKLTGATQVSVRRPSDENGKQYGMIKSLDGSEIFGNGFFGIAENS